MFWDKYYLGGLLLGVVLGGLGVIASAAGPEGVAWAWPWDSVLLLLVNVNWFVGGLMTRRGSLSGISGSCSGPRPKIPKGSGDPKQILDLIWFRGYAVFLNGYGITHTTHAPKKWTSSFSKQIRSFTWRLCYFTGGYTVFCLSCVF